MAAATTEELGEFFAQEGRDSWCALEVYEWMQNENCVRDETQKLMMSIMYEWVMILVEGERSVEEAKRLLRGDMKVSAAEKLIDLKVATEEILVNFGGRMNENVVLTKTNLAQGLHRIITTSMIKMDVWIPQTRP